MLMETFAQLTRQDKYVWDVSIVSDSASVMLTALICAQMIGHVRVPTFLNGSC